jgi:MFS family permease
VTTDTERRDALGALLASTWSISLGAIPVFLLGALAVFVREEIGFSEARLGIVASAYYATSAIMSVPGGRMAEALGGRRAVALAALISGASLLGIAVLVHSWWTLLAFMVAAGIANGAALPASNLVIARRVPSRHQGIAFGIKQSSGPFSTLVAGAAVPAIGLTIGWRWAFAFVAAASIPLIAMGRRAPLGRTAAARRSRTEVATGPLVILAFGAAAAVVGGSSIAAFYVESAVSAGIDPGVAGTLLAVGSLIGVGFRITWGWVGDRSPRTHVPLLSSLLVIGALGFALLGRVSSVPALAVVTIVTFASGWGWPALFNFAIVSRSRSAPALATGIAGTGLYAGGIVGPVAFGALVESADYRAAWTFVSIAAAVAAGLFLVGGRLLERDRAAHLSDHLSEDLERSAEFGHP